MIHGMVLTNTQFTMRESTDKIFSKNDNLLQRSNGSLPRGIQSIIELFFFYLQALLLGHTVIGKVFSKYFKYIQEF